MRPSISKFAGSFIAAVLLLTSLMIISDEVNDEVDAAIAFLEDIRIDMDITGADQENPSVIVSGNDVFIFWQDDRNGNWDIYTRSSHNGGLSFGPEVRVDDTGRTSTIADDVSEQLYPRASFGPNGEVFVVWEDERLGKAMVFYSISTDKGASYSKNQVLSDSVFGDQRSPDIVTTKTGDIHVAWRDSRDSMNKYQIYASMRAPGERDFRTPVRVSDISTEYDCKAPALDSSSGDATHIVWNDDRVWDEDVYIATSRNRGSSYESSIRVSADPTGSDQTEPEIAAREDVIYVMWSDPRTNSADIYYSTSRDNATTFSVNMLLNPKNNSGHQYEPRAALDEVGNLTVCWTSSPGLKDRKSDIQMTKLSWNGTLEEVYTVNDPINGVIQNQPDTAVNNRDGSFFVWMDNRNDQDKDIYFTRTTLSGEEGYAPVIENSTVSPEIGGLGTKFTFKATYVDLENDAPAPGYPKVNLFYKSAADTLYPYPGSPYNMTRILLPVQDFNYYNGENYIVTLKIDRELDLYYQISAQASSGNRTIVETEMSNLPVIDGTGPSFELIEPTKGTWIESNIIPFTVKITDELSGVEPWSIFYKKYQIETGGWGAWQRKGTSVHIDNSSLLYKVNITFLEGKDGKVKFRAMDKIQFDSSNPQYSISDTYPVWVDPEGPQIQIVEPGPGKVYNTTELTFSTLITDSGSGLDPDSMEVSYSLTGVTGYGAWMNISQVNGIIEEEGGDIRFDFNISLSYGYNNYVRIRAKDVLGNTGSSTNVQVIIEKEKVVDTSNKPPSRVDSIQPKITGSLRPHITWSPSFDPEGELVNYYLSVFDVTLDEFLVDAFQVTPGFIYWDPTEEQKFTAGHTYLISITPNAGGQDGPETTSSLVVSTDANSPPEPVKNLTPKATSDTTPVLSWDPSEDPDGDEVYYFLRVGSSFSGSDVMDWTSVLSNTKYLMKKQLSPGTYYIDIFSSDGKDFAPISHFTMSIGIYNPVLDLQRSQVVVFQGSGTTINLTISNKGFTFDTIEVRVDGDVVNRTDIDLLIGKDRIDNLAPGSRTNTTFHVDARNNAELGIYSLTITLVSADGHSTYTRGLSIRVVDESDPTGKPSPRIGDEEGSDDTLVMLVLFIILLVAIILAMGYAYYRIDRKERIEEVEVVSKNKGPGGLSGKGREGIGSGKKKKKGRALPPKKED